MNMRELLPLGPMARFLGVKSAWLRGEAEAGRLPSVRAGDTFLFNPAAVERVLIERASATKGAPGLCQEVATT